MPKAPFDQVKLKALRLQFELGYLSNTEPLFPAETSFLYDFRILLVISAAGVFLFVYVTLLLGSKIRLLANV